MAKIATLQRLPVAPDVPRLLCFGVNTAARALSQTPDRMAVQCSDRLRLELTGSIRPSRGGAQN